MSDNYLNPDWSKASKVHDWRNYISDEVKRLWHGFSDEQKLAIMKQADDIASNEDWE